MDTILLPLLDDLRVSLAEALTDTIAGAPCVVTLQDGGAGTADWCSCGGRGGGCGMGWVRLDNLYPSSAAFPSVDSKPGSCTSVLAAVIEVGAYRCAPMSNTQGQPPSAAEQTQGVLEVVSDALALACTFRMTEAVTSRPNVLGRWTPRSGGDCHGGSMTATVQLVPRSTAVRADPRRRPTGR